MDRSPAFRFYAADFLSDENVMAMSLEEIGAYTIALCVAWLQGGIPADSLRLSRLLRGADEQTVAAVVACFKPDLEDPSRLLNPRLEKERAKQEDYSAKKSEAGKTGSAKRWGNTSKEATHSHGSAIAVPSSCHSSATSLPLADDSFSFSLSFSPSHNVKERKEGKDSSEAEKESEQDNSNNHILMDSVPDTQTGTPSPAPQNTHRSAACPVDLILQKAENLTGATIGSIAWSKQAEKVSSVLKNHSEEAVLAIMTSAMEKPHWQKKILGTDTDPVKFPAARLLSNLPAIMNERQPRKFANKSKLGPTTKPIIAPKEALDNEIVFEIDEEPKERHDWLRKPPLRPGDPGYTQLEAQEMTFCELCAEFTMLSNDELYAHVQEKHPEQL